MSGYRVATCSHVNSHILFLFFFHQHVGHCASRGRVPRFSFIVISPDASNLLPPSLILPWGEACSSCRNSRARECSRRRCLENRPSIYTSATYARGVAFRDGAVAAPSPGASVRLRATARSLSLSFALLRSRARKGERNCNWKRLIAPLSAITIKRLSNG